MGRNATIAEQLQRGETVSYRAHGNSMTCDVPDILTVGISSPLGYLGGMFSAYFGMKNL